MEGQTYRAGAKYALLGQGMENHPSRDLLKMVSDIELELLNISSEKELALVLGNTSYKGYLVLPPLGEACLKYMDHISEASRQISAVNTIKRDDDGKLYGYNTDIRAFKYLIPKCIEGWKAVILGTRAGAIAAAAALKEYKAGRVILVDDNPDAARARLGGEYEVVSYNDLRIHRDARILVNTTFIGMYPNGHISPFDTKLIRAKAFRNLELAIDLVYNPSRTKFLQEIERSAGLDNKMVVLRLSHNIRERLQGKRHADFYHSLNDNLRGRSRVFTTAGTDMMLRQTLFAKDIWLGDEGSIDDSDAVYDLKKKLLEERYNVVLIGMPGSGKSSIARMMARELGRPFIDVDREVEALMGERIADVLVDGTKGEAYMREFETKALMEACNQRGCIIATGGGAVLRPINRDIIREQGCVVYIRRPLDMLSLKNRPLSQREGVEKLYKERVGIYRRVADVTITNAHTFGESLDKKGERNSYTYDLKRFAYKVIKQARYKLYDIIDEHRTQFELAEKKRNRRK